MDSNRSHRQGDNSQSDDDDLLDDPGRLETIDTGGLLRAAATAGAQVRSTAAAAKDAGLRKLTGERPRALVLLTRPGAASAAAPLLLALLGPSCPVPVVTTRSVPMWVGALDIVLANTTDPGDRELADGLARAVRSGAQLVLTAPADGPVAAAVAGRAVLVVPRIEVPPGLALPRTLTAGLLLLDALGLLATDVEALAGELDREAERDYVAHESLVNPAKSLALRLAGRTPLLWGTDPVATAVAGHCAAALAAHAGVVAHAAGFHEAAALPVLRREAIRGSAETDVFQDPYEDAAPHGALPAVRPVLLGVLTDGGTESERATALDALPAADLVTADEELMVRQGDPGAAASAAAVLALRFDFAALYLGLSRGVLGRPGWLGSAGTVAE
ncbi:MAG TPA: SIS domain-containing protein [Pseudonocardiaceae bacterium]|jgi:TusA-related sulfurtransferase|nr:SIS domain-containing protein [Pseudonocardiaceae bacterium]